MQIQVLHLNRTIDENVEELDGAGGGDVEITRMLYPVRHRFQGK